MAEKRRYELKRRAEQMADTRRRIVEATVELHRTVGPAATQISEIARRARVQRDTVYKHFPDDAALLGACSAHWRALHPTPDPARWAATAEPAERLRVALRELYAWFRETEPMTGNVLRDAAVLPDLRTIIDRGLGSYLDRVGQTLAGCVRRDARVDAAVRAAVDVHFWRALAPLGDAQAADLAAGFIELAAGGPGAAGGQ